MEPTTPGTTGSAPARWSRCSGRGVGPASTGVRRLSEAMLAAARAVPGFVDFATFAGDDGERVSLVTFATPEAHAAWRDDPRHRAAQRRGVDEFYEWYSIQVATCERASYRTPPGWG